ncbi:hypothetical protein AT268_17680 [Bacillus cereus]|uniref:Uncharacterized protein n=1 Tax=Bacillus cereus TaxID=1396 RepID=A0A9X0SLU6_BACCE|nr:hypothetical protein AT268_17680 [Bacillus cereus]OUB27246.1 hypothetical protein BK739_17750 [Bacillus thuringiensis serovar pirenaica]
MTILNDKTMNDSLHEVKTSKGFSFIVSTYELRNLSPWVKPSEHSFDDLLFYRKLILCERKSMKRQLKRGYKPIKTLQESDHFIWCISEDLFHSPVIFREERGLNFEISEEDRDILKGNMIDRLARQLL